MSPATRARASTEQHMTLRRTQHQFRRACDQIVHLNKKMELVLYQYQKAREQGARSFRYKLRFRLAIVEGMRNMFYEYANRKAHSIVNLRRDLFGEIVTGENRDDVIDMESDDSFFDEDNDSQSDTESDGTSESEAEEEEESELL